MAVVFGSDLQKTDSTTPEDTQKTVPETPSAPAETEQKQTESAPADTTSDVSKTSDSSEKSGDKGTPGEPEKATSTIDRRIGQLTKKIHERDRENDELKSRIAKLEQATESSTAAAAKRENVEPVRADFDSDAEYYKAIGAFGARQEIARKQAEEAAEAQRKRDEEAQEEFNQAAAQIPDWDQIVEDLDESVVLAQPAAIALQSIPAARRPAVVASLVKNRDQLDFINALPALDQRTSIFQIAAEIFDGRKVKQIVPKPLTKPEPDEPIQPLRDSVGMAVPFDPEKAQPGDPRLQEWRRNRRAQLAKQG